MNGRTFGSPVFVKDGNCIIQEIGSLEDALDFMYEWPKSRRGVIYETALRACQRAFEGDYPLEAARNAFSGFAKSAQILEDVDTVLPWMIGDDNPKGGVPA